MSKSEGKTEMKNITSDFRDELISKIEARTLFAEDIQALAKEGFISDTKLVEELLSYCQERKHSDEINIWADAKGNVSELIDLLGKMLSDVQLYKLRKDLKAIIYG